MVKVATYICKSIVSQVIKRYRHDLSAAPDDAVLKGDQSEFPALYPRLRLVISFRSCTIIGDPAIGPFYWGPVNWVPD